MTMLYTHQTSPIHTFSHNVCNRGNVFQDLSAKKPLQYRVPAPVDLAEKRSTKREQMESNVANLVMPCPKKLNVLCSNALLGGNQITSPVTSSPRWTGPVLSHFEDNQETEEDYPAESTENDQDNFFEQAACAELMEIMSSSGSSRASSNSSSPQPSLHEMESAAATFGEEDHSAFFDSFSIIRANNPIANDESFKPSLMDSSSLEISQRFQSYIARHRHQAKVFDFNLNVDEAGETQAPSRSNLTHILMV